MSDDSEAVFPDSPDSGDDERWWSQIDLHELIRTIERYVGRRYANVSSHDAEEIATEAILRVLQANKAGRLKLTGDPTGYLVAVARNIVFDRSRTWAKHSEVPVSSLESLGAENPDNSAIAEFINQDAARESIRRALATARSDGDHTTYRVITFVLNEAERTGELPSNREVASHLGLSHTGVAKSLARFRRILESGED